MKLTIGKARRAMIVAAAAAATAGLAIGLPALAQATPASQAAAARQLPLCETPGLVVWLDTNGNAALGSVAYNLEFTNLSGHRCTLNGYPFLWAMNLRHHQLGSVAKFDRTVRPHLITLGNDKTAIAVLTIVDAGNFPAARCHPTTAAGLKVFPPNQTRSAAVPFPFGACARTGPIYLIVRPVHR